MRLNYHNRKSKSKSKQKGVALFVTLLVVTIATLLATEIWFNNNLDISRTYNNRASYQANHYAKGMVLWAKDVLRQDFEVDATFDNHSEGWNQTIAGIQLEDAILSGKLIDLDSKFNLNNIVIDGALKPISYEYFKRILVNLELDVGIADKIVDWIDENQFPMPLGAEDSVYLSKRPSYRTAGQPFVHISELKLIDGIDETTYQRLKGFVTVLPILGNSHTKVNINTASSLLLKSLDIRISAKDALVLYDNGNASNKSIDDFFMQRVIQYLNLGQNGELRDLIDTRSQWFQAQINVKMEQANFKKYALLYRSSKTAIVMQWSDTAFD